MEAAAEPAAAEEESPGSAPDPTEKLKAKKLVTHLKPVRVAAGKPVVTAPKPIAVSKPIAAPKPVVAAKPAAPPKPAQKPAAVGKASKGGKAGGYVDPFDN
jgi:hypothetical protein